MQTVTWLPTNRCCWHLQVVNTHGAEPTPETVVAAEAAAEIDATCPPGVLPSSQAEAAHTGLAQAVVASVEPVDDAESGDVDAESVCSREHLVRM